MIASEEPVTQLKAIKLGVEHLVMEAVTMLNDYEIQTNLFKTMGNMLTSGIANQDLQEPVAAEVRNSAL